MRERKKNDKAFGMMEKLHYLNRVTHHYNGVCFLGINVPDFLFLKVSSTGTIGVDRICPSQLRDTDRRLTFREKILEFCEFLSEGVQPF